MTIRVAMVMHGPGEQALMPVFLAALHAQAESTGHTIIVSVYSQRCGWEDGGERCEEPVVGAVALKRLGAKPMAREKGMLLKEMSQQYFDVVLTGLQTKLQFNAAKCAKENDVKVVGFAELLIRLGDKDEIVGTPPGGSSYYPDVVKQCSALTVPEALRSSAERYLRLERPEGTDVLGLGLPETLDLDRITGDRGRLLFIGQRHWEGQVKLVEEFKLAASSLHLESRELDHPARKLPRGKPCRKHPMQETVAPLPNADVVVTEYSNLAYAYALRGSQVIYCMEEGIRPRLLPLEDPRFPNCRWASPGGLQAAIEAALQRAESFDAQSLPVPDTDAGPFLEWVRNNLP